jgi:hypothetical protein
MGRASVDTIINGLEDYLLRPLSATTQTSAISAVNTVAGFQTFIGKQKKAIGDLGGYSLVLDSAEYATLKSNLVAGLSQPDYWNDGAPFGVKVYESIVLNTLGIKGFFFHRSVMSWGAGVEKGFAVAGVEATPAVAGNGVPMIFMQYSNGGDIMAAFGFYIGKTVSSSLNTLAVKLT